MAIEESASSPPSDKYSATTEHSRSGPSRRAAQAYLKGLFVIFSALPCYARDFEVK